MQGFTWYDFWARILPDWLTSIGTVGAVIAAVVLSTRDNRIRIRVRAGVRVIVTRGQAHKSPDYLMIELVNLGRRNATVVNIGWEYGWPWSKQKAVQTLDPRVGLTVMGKIPTTLSDGQSETCFLLLDEWLAANREEMLRRGPSWRWLSCKFIRVCAYTSTGDTYRSRIESGLIDAMLQRGHYKPRPSSVRPG